MRRRGPLGTALLILLTLLGCSNVPQRKIGAGDPSAATPYAVTTIRVFGMPGDPVVDAAINAFARKHKDIKVEKVSDQVTPGAVINSVEVLRERLKSNDIDVFAVGGEARLLVKENQILALDPFIKRSGIDLRPYAALTDAMRINGQLYALPIHAYTEAIIYNVDLFNAAGVPLPESGWTWDDFRAAAAKLTHGAGESKVWGFSSDYGVLNLAFNMLYERTDGNQSLQPHDAREILAYWSTLIDTDKAVYPAASPDLRNPGLVEHRQHFFEGKAAMTTVPLANLRFSTWDLKVKWDLAPFPLWPGGKLALTARPSSYGIAAGSQNQDAAWEFLSFLFSAEGAVALARAGQFPIVRTEAVKQAWFDRSPAPPRSTEVFLTADLRSTAPNPDQKATVVANVFAEVLRKVLEGGSEWEVLYKQFLADREKILAAN